MEFNLKGNSELVLSMLIFGTVGIFRHGISMTSGFIAMSRGIIGALFLFILMVILRKKPSLKAIKNNLVLLLLSGAFIGFNWMLLFEAYNYTSIACATLSYYMAPVFVIVASAFLFNERLTGVKGICVIVSLLGMTLVSGVFETGIKNISEIKGILLGLGAAAFYASVILMNQKIVNISAYDKTLVQIGSAGIVLIPYVLIRGEIGASSFDLKSVILLLSVCIIHTGIAYALYFASMESVKAQNIALLSYIDPISAVLLSALVLKEAIGILEMIGTVAVIASSIASLIYDNKKSVKNQ